MNITQSKIILNKAEADRIFAMARSAWEDYTKKFTYPEGWKVQIDPSPNGSGILGKHPLSWIELTFRPYFDNEFDPPEILFIITRYPVGKAPKFTNEFKHDLEYEAKKNLGPGYSTSATYTKSPSFEEIEMMIQKTWQKLSALNLDVFNSTCPPQRGQGTCLPLIKTQV